MNVNLQWIFQDIQRCLYGWPITDHLHHVMWAPSCAVTSLNFRKDVKNLSALQMRIAVSCLAFTVVGATKDLAVQVAIDLCYHWYTESSIELNAASVNMPQNLTRRVFDGHALTLSSSAAYAPAY